MVMEEIKFNKLIEELDFELENLGKLIKNIEDENKLIELRVRKKELFLEKLKIINSFKGDNYG